VSSAAGSGTALTAAGSGTALTAAGSGTALTAAGSGTGGDEGREAPLLLLFFLGRGTDVVDGPLTGWRSSMGAVTGAGRAVSDSVDSVEDDSEGESHELRLSRLPRR